MTTPKNSPIEGDGLSREARARIAHPLTGEALRVGMARKTGSGSLLASNYLTRTKQLLLLTLTLGLLAFIVYIRWIATPEALLFLGATQLDKVAHLSGGVFLALIAEWRFRRMPLAAFLSAVFVLTAGWEAIEFFFDSGTRFFYANAPDLWRLDSAGDIVAAYLGGYGYWVFLSGKSRSSADEYAE